jgi:hypothetical protein
MGMGLLPKHGMCLHPPLHPQSNLTNVVILQQVRYAGVDQK